MINLGVLEHMLRRDGYMEELIQEIITALKQKKELDEYKHDLSIL